MRAEHPEQRPEWPEMVFGSKSVRGLLPLLEQLPPLSDHPNRALQTRDVFVAHLLAFFNPTLRSLRTLEDFSQTRQARRYLAVERLPRSTLADFHRLVDPVVLEPVVAHLLRDTAWNVRRWPPVSSGQGIALVIARTGGAGTAAAAVAVCPASSRALPRSSSRVFIRCPSRWDPRRRSPAGAGSSPNTARRTGPASCPPRTARSPVLDPGCRRPRGGGRRRPSAGCPQRSPPRRPPARGSRYGPCQRPRPRR